MPLNASDIAAVVREWLRLHTTPKSGLYGGGGLDRMAVLYMRSCCRTVIDPAPAAELRCVQCVLLGQGAPQYDN